MYQVQQTSSKCLASLVPPHFLNRDLISCSSQPWSPNSTQQQMPAQELQFPCPSAVYHCCLLKERSQFRRHMFTVSHPLSLKQPFIRFLLLPPQKVVYSQPAPASNQPCISGMGIQSWHSTSLPVWAAGKLEEVPTHTILNPAYHLEVVPNARSCEANSVQTECSSQEASLSISFSSTFFIKRTAIIFTLTLLSCTNNLNFSLVTG